MYNSFNVEKIKRPLFLILSFILISGTLLYNIKRLLNNCIHAIDFSLYQQAIYGFTTGDLNPYLTVRSINIFNDHFEPALFFAVPFAFLSNFNPASLLFFEWLWFAATFLSFYLVRKNTTNVFYAILMIILCKGALSAIEYPIHPETWTILPIFWAIYFIYRNNFKAIILLSIFLCFFKEMFPFCIISLSSFYLLNRDLKKFGILLFTGILLTFIIFFIRPYFIGPIHGHGNSLLYGLLLNPIATIWGQIKTFYWLSFLKYYSPFFIPIVLLILKSRPIKLKSILNSPVLAIFLFLFPIMLIFFLSGQLTSHHHAIALSIGIVGAIVFHPQFDKLPAKGLTLAMIFFILSSGSYYRDVFKSVVLNIESTKKCTYGAHKKKNMDKLKKTLSSIRQEATILSTGGIVPQIMKPALDIYILRCFSDRRKRNRFKYLLLELNKSGDTFPIASQKVKSIYKKCLPYAKEIVLKNSDFVLLNGIFDRNCLGPKL